MKVLLVNDYSTLTGGAEISIVSLRDELRRRGHDARLFASSAGSDEVPRHADYECFGTTSRFRTALQTLNPSAYLKLSQTLKEFAPDVVHVYMFLTQLSPLILPLIKPHKAIYQVMWQRPICPTGFKLLPNGTTCNTRYGTACFKSRCLSPHDWLMLMIQMKLWRRWSNSFDRVHSISQSLARQLAVDGTVSHETMFLGARPFPARQPLDDTPIAAYAGRFSREKGTDVLCHAFALVLKELPNARLLLAGDGPQKAIIENLVSELGIQHSVEFLGHLSHEELGDSLSKAWVQAMPTIMHEPFGLATAEALIRGTAVVASNCGGPSEVVTDGETGYLVPPNNVEQLAGALLKVLYNKDKAELMGARAREKALGKLTLDVYVERLIEIYQELIEPRSKVPTSASTSRCGHI